MITNSIFLFSSSLLTDVFNAHLLDMTKDGTLNTLFKDFDTDSERIQECATQATDAISDNTSLSIKHFGGVFTIHVSIMFVSILYTLCIMKRKDKTGGVDQENTKERNDIYNENDIYNDCRVKNKNRETGDHQVKSAVILGGEY